MITWSQYEELRIVVAEFPFPSTNLSLLIEDEERLFVRLAQLARAAS